MSVKSLVKPLAPHTPNGFDGIWKNGPSITPGTTWVYCEGMFAYSVVRISSHPIGHFGIVDEA